MMKRRKFFEKGQGIVEYILITAFVALAAIGIFRVFREDLSSAYRKAGEAVVRGVDDSLGTEEPNG